MQDSLVLGMRDMALKLYHNIFWYLFYDSDDDDLTITPSRCFTSSLLAIPIFAPHMSFEWVSQTNNFINYNL